MDDKTNGAASLVRFDWDYAVILVTIGDDADLDDPREPLALPVPLQRRISAWGSEMGETYGRWGEGDDVHVPADIEAELLTEFHAIRQSLTALGYEFEPVDPWWVRSNRELS